MRKSSPQPSPQKFQKIRPHTGQAKPLRGRASPKPLEYQSALASQTSTFACGTSAYSVIWPSNTRECMCGPNFDVPQRRSVVVQRLHEQRCRHHGLRPNTPPNILRGGCQIQHDELASCREACLSSRKQLLCGSGYSHMPHTIAETPAECREVASFVCMNK